MRARVFIALGEDTQLGQLLGRLMPGAKVISVACLDRLGSLLEDPQFRVVIDPRSVRPCCLKRLENVGQASTVIMPGRGRRDGAKLSNCGRVSTRQAWRMRSILLSLDQKEETLRLFVAVARAHARERYTVREAAATLILTERHLHRLIVQPTGCSPSVILGLARIASAAQALAETRLRLADVALLHSFYDLATMTRLFKQYVGMCPGAYRNNGVARNVRKRQRILSEYANGSAPRLMV